MYDAEKGWRGIRFTDLMEPLEPKEAEGLYRLLLIIEAEPSVRVTRINEALAFMNKILELCIQGRDYATTATLNSRKTYMKKWRQSYQMIVESLAHPSVGEERLAIVLAYYRDVVGGTPRKSSENQTPEQDMTECIRQLELLKDSYTSKIKEDAYV